jgi:hypothetical protein
MQEFDLSQGAAIALAARSRRQLSFKRQGKHQGRLAWAGGRALVEGDGTQICSHDGRSAELCRINVF